MVWSHEQALAKIVEIDGKERMYWEGKGKNVLINWLFRRSGGNRWYCEENEACFAGGRKLFGRATETVEGLTPWLHQGQVPVMGSAKLKHSEWE